MTSPRNLYRVRPRGIIRDVEPLDLPPEFYTNGKNVVFRNELAERIGGYLQVFGTPLGNPLHLRANLRDAVAYWLYTWADGIGVTSGAAHSDITPAAGAPAGRIANDFTSTSLNGIPVFNWRSEAPVSWDGSPASKCTALPGWQTGHKCDAIGSFKNYLIAMGYDNGTTFDPNLVVWSDAAAAGNLPASWTPAANNDAGSVSLAEEDGVIIDGAPLKDQYIIYKRGSTYTLDFIRGNFVFVARRLFASTGILARNCAVEFRGRQYVFTDGDIIVHDGYQAESLVDQRWRRFVFDNIDNNNFQAAFTALYEAKSEIWFCFPTKGNTFCDLALVYNYELNRFGIRDLGTDDVRAAHAAVGIVPAAAAPATDWDSQAASWDTYSGSWNRTNFNPSQDELITANTDNTFYAVDTGPDAAGKVIMASLSRESLDLGEPSRVKYVKAIWPRVIGLSNGSLRIRVGTQMRPEEPISWGIWQTYTPGFDAKLDVNVRGRFISVEIESEAGSRWRSSGFDLEFRFQGRY